MVERLTFVTRGIAELGTASLGYAQAMDGASDEARCWSVSTGTVHYDAHQLNVVACVDRPSGVDA